MLVAVYLIQKRNESSGLEVRFEEINPFEYAINVETSLQLFRRNKLLNSGE